MFFYFVLSRKINLSQRVFFPCRQFKLTAREWMIVPDTNDYYFKLAPN